MASLADVVVGAVLAPEPVANYGHRPAAVAGDALVLAKVRSLLFLEITGRNRISVPRSAMGDVRSRAHLLLLLLGLHRGHLGLDLGALRSLGGVVHRV